MVNRVLIDLHADLLCHCIDHIVLEVLCDSTDHCDSHAEQEEESNALHKLRFRERVEFTDIPIDDHTEYLWVKEGEDLIDRSEDECKE